MPHTEDELKKALKAFKKRMKLTRLDDDSKLGHSPLTGGKKDQIVAIQPRISIAQPPPPDAVHAVPPARAPAAAEASQGPAKTAAPPMDYLSRLEAHLNAYKNYPYVARIHREEGIVQLRFSLDRSGHVLSYDVVGSSGFASLDAEARQMIRRADPFPPVPPEYLGESLDLTVPVVFSFH